MGILLEEGYTYLNKYIYIYPWPLVHSMLLTFHATATQNKKKPIINSCLPFFFTLNYIWHEYCQHEFTFQNCTDTKEKMGFLIYC